MGSGPYNDGNTTRINIEMDGDQLALLFDLSRHSSSDSNFDQRNFVHLVKQLNEPEVAISHHKTCPI